MKSKNSRITYLSLAVLAIVIAFAVVQFEMSTYGDGGVLLMHFVSDGFFASAVFYLGLGLLTFISDAGNFYGIQYLGYTLAYLFSFKKSFEDKKDYFTYCMEKQEKQKTKKGLSVKWILILIGLICLFISVVFAALYYRMGHGA